MKGYNSFMLFELLHGNSEKILQKLQKEKFKLIVSSPPYNVGKKYENVVPIESYLTKQERIIKNMVHVLHENGSICWQVGNFINNGEVYPLDIFYYKIFKDLGLKLRNRIIWHFGHGLHSSKRFSGRYETILWFTKSDQYTFNLDTVRVPSKYPGKRHFKGPKKGQLSGNPKGKNPSDIWEILISDWDKEVWSIPNVKSNHVEKTIHPCQFPIELIERLVLALTDEDDWVLDPYAGVGTTLVAALKNRRNAVGIEKEKEYVEIGTKRIDDLFSGKLRSRPINKPIYDHTKSNLSKIPVDFVKA